MIPWIAIATHSAEPSLMPGFLVAMAVFILYWLPAANAYSKHRKQRTAILLTNLLTGWTGIGWIVAMIWSAKED